MIRRILVIEDNLEVVEMLKEHLPALGFELEHAESGELGLEMIGSREYEMVLLDLMLPGIDGIDVCREVRARKPHLPVIMLTSKTDELNRVLGLEMGADDYVTKPFSPAELKARIKAILRRAGANRYPQSKQLDFGDVQIDLTKRKMIVVGEEIALTALQFDLVAMLASYPGRPFTRDDLNEGLFGYEVSGFDQAISTHISRIRAKVEPNPANPKYILTVRGVGYCFAENA